MVAVVQLRLLMLRNVELFENFVDVSVTHLPAERTAKQVELFRRICTSDLDTCLRLGPTSHHQRHHNQEASSSSNGSKAATSSDAGAASADSPSKAKLWPNTTLPPTLSRIQRLKLYYWYARLLLDTIALKCSHLGLSVLRPVYKDAYACCMAYLGLFVATMVPNGLFWGHNSTVVTPVYCGIFALRIVGLISTNAGAANLQVAEAGEKKGEDLGLILMQSIPLKWWKRWRKFARKQGRQRRIGGVRREVMRFSCLRCWRRPRVPGGASWLGRRGMGIEMEVERGRVGWKGERKRGREEGENGGGGRQDKSAKLAKGVVRRVMKVRIAKGMQWTASARRRSWQEPKGAFYSRRHWWNSFCRS